MYASCPSHVPPPVRPAGRRSIRSTRPCTQPFHGYVILCAPGTVPGVLAPSEGECLSANAGLSNKSMIVAHGPPSAPPSSTEPSSRRRALLPHWDWRRRRLTDIAFRPCPRQARPLGISVLSVLCLRAQPPARRPAQQVSARQEYLGPPCYNVFCPFIKAHQTGGVPSHHLLHGTSTEYMPPSTYIQYLRTAAA